MGKRGPAPEPSGLKLIKGNPGHRPINDKEPKPMPIFELPSPPKWLDRIAKGEWRRMGMILIKLGLLTEADLTSFAAYCAAYSRWRHCEDIVARHYRNEGTYSEMTSAGMRGSYKKQRHSDMITLEKSFAQMIALAQRFGMDPSSRTQIKVNRPIRTEDFL